MKILSALVAVVFVAAAPPALAQGSASEKGDDTGTMMDGGMHPKSHKSKKHKTSRKMDGGTMRHHMMDGGSMEHGGHMMDGGAMMHGGHMMDGGAMEHGGMMEGHPGTDGGM